MLLATGLVLVAFLFFQWRAAIHRNRSITDESFRIAGNLHSVGLPADFEGELNVVLVAFQRDQQDDVDT